MTMANLKLSQLPAASALTGDEIVPVVQAGQTRRASAAALAMLGQGAWQVATLAAPWANYGDAFATAAFRKDGRRVELRGVVKGGAGGSVVFTLPIGLRPAAQRIFTMLSDAAAPTRVDVRANGEVLVGLPPSTTVAWLSLDGIGFSID
jgi:hypothetical protein